MNALFHLYSLDRKGASPPVVVDTLDAGGSVVHGRNCPDAYPPTDSSNNRVHTDRHGMMAFLVPQGKTAAARMRAALLMPLGLVRFEAHLKPGRDLHTLRDVQRTHALQQLYADPVKNAVGMFVCELLSHTIQECEQNEPLFRFIDTSVRILDELPHGVANFHICFLYHLGAFLGIEPGQTHPESAVPPADS